MDIGFVMQEVASPTNCMLSCITGYGNSSVSELCCTATDTQRDANIRNLMLLPNILWHYLCIWCFCNGVSPWVFFKVTRNWMFLLWSTSTFNGKSKKEKKKKR